MNKAPQFFKKYLSEDFITLAEDKVVNVRICLARGLKDHCRQFE